MNKDRIYLIYIALVARYGPSEAMKRLYQTAKANR